MDEAVRDFWIKVAVVPAHGVSETWYEESLFAMRMQDTLHLRKVYHAFSERARKFLGEGAQGEVLHRRVRFNFVRGNEEKDTEGRSLKDNVFGVILVADSDANLDMESLETSFRNVKETFPHSIVEQYLVVHEDETVKQCWLQDGALFSSPSHVPMVTAIESIATLLVQEIAQQMAQAAPGDLLFDDVVNEHVLDVSSVTERESAEESWKEVQKKLFYGEAQLLVNNGVASLNHFDSAEEICHTLGVESLLPFIAKRRLVAKMVTILDRGSLQFESREIYDLQVLFQECIGIHLRMNEPTEAVRLNLIFCKVLIRGDQDNREQAVSFLNETQHTLRMMPRAKGHLWIQSEVCLLFMELGAWRKACYLLARILKSIPQTTDDKNYGQSTCKNISKLWENLINRGEGLSLFRWPGVALGFLRQLCTYSAENHSRGLQWRTFSQVLRNQYKFLDRSSQLLVWKFLQNLCNRHPELSCQRTMLLGMTEPMRLDYHDPCAAQIPDKSGSKLFIVNSMDKLKQQDSLRPQLVVGDTFTLVVRVKNPLRVKTTIRRLGVIFKGVPVVCSAVSLSVGPLEDTQAYFNARAVESGSMDIVGCSVDADGICWDEIWADACSEGRRAELERMHKIPVREEEPSISVSVGLPSIFHALDLYAGQELEVNVVIVNTGHLPAALRQISARMDTSTRAGSLRVSQGSLPECLHPGQEAVVAIKISTDSKDTSLGKNNVQVNVDFVRSRSKSNECHRRATTNFKINVKPAMILTNQFPIKARASASSETFSDWGRVVQVENETKRDLEVSVLEPVQARSGEAQFVLSPRAQKCILIERQRFPPAKAQQPSTEEHGSSSVQTKARRQKKLVWSFLGADNRGFLDIPANQTLQEKPRIPTSEPPLKVLLSQVPWHGSDVETASGHPPTLKTMDPIGFCIKAVNNSSNNDRLRVTLSPHSAPEHENPPSSQPDDGSFPAALWHGLKDDQPILVASGTEIEHAFGMVFLKPGTYCVSCMLGETSDREDDSSRHIARSFCTVHVVH